METMVIKFMVGMYLCYPLGLIMRLIPANALKHLFNCLIGIFMLQWIFDSTWIHPFISALITYVICRFGPKKYNHMIVFTLLMVHVVVCHAYYQYAYYLSDVFEFTGSQMILTMKLSSFAFNLFDGYNLEAAQKDKKVVIDPKNEPIFRKYAITKFPSFIEFMGYAMSFSCILSGPSFEYKEYIDSIEGTKLKEFSKEFPTVKLPSPSAIMKSSLLASLYRILIGTVCLGCHMFINAKTPLRNGVISSEEFIAAHPVFYRIPYTILAIYGDAMKYYAVWKIAEAGCIIAGFGFEGVDKEGTCVANRSRAWNKGTQSWLERYVYRRTHNSLVATYFISALWHGLYPGYFFFFLSVPLLSSIERLTRLKLNPIFVPNYNPRDAASTTPKGMIEIGYTFFCWFFTLLFVDYVAQPFSQLSYERSVRVLASYHYIPYGILAGVWLILMVLPTPRNKDKGKEGKKEST